MSEQFLVNPLTNQPISSDELNDVASLIRRQVEAEKLVEDLTKKLDEVQGQLRNLSEVQVPEALANLGLSELKLTDGTKVTVSTFYAASIPEEKKPEAFAWLRSTNNDSLIKRDLTCKFGKGEDQAANELAARLDALGYSFTDKSSVHPQTLKAFVREIMEAGKPFPSELFGVFVGKRTKLTPPKA